MTAYFQAAHPLNPDRERIPLAKLTRGVTILVLAYRCETVKYV